MKNKKLKVLFIFGTRPELIKFIPLIKEFKLKKNITVKTFHTKQHDYLLKNILKDYRIYPDYNSNIVNKKLSISEFASKLMLKLNKHFNKNKYDYIFVLGDTTTALVSALTAFNNNQKIAYIESGLRTYDFKNPWPEESFRQIISRISNFNFCPSKEAKNNLLNERINKKTIFEVGNPIIDCIKYIFRKKIYLADKNYKKFNKLINNKKLVLITIHRRENQNKNLDIFFKSLKKIVKDNIDCFFLFSIHPTPIVKKRFEKYFMNVNYSNFYSENNINHPLFCYLLEKAFLIFTDSGGIQEESSYFGTPTILMRKTSERQELIGKNILYGSFDTKIINLFKKLKNDDFYKLYNKKSYPYGKGDSTKKILKVIQ